MVVVGGPTIVERFRWEGKMEGVGGEKVPPAEAGMLSPPFCFSCPKYLYHPVPWNTHFGEEARASVVEPVFAF